MRNRHGKPWTPEEDAKLIDCYNSKESIKEIAILLERKSGAIRSRIKKLNIPPVKTLKPARFIKHNNGRLDIKNGVPIIDADMAFRRFHFTYVLVNLEGFVYVGFSTNVWKRIAQHNDNKGARATRDCGPWFPVSIYCFAAQRDAMAMELSIKRDFSAYVASASQSFQEVIGQSGHSIDITDLKLA